MRRLPPAPRPPPHETTTNTEVGDLASPDLRVGGVLQPFEQRPPVRGPVAEQTKTETENETSERRAGGCALSEKGGGERRWTGGIVKAGGRERKRTEERKRKEGEKCICGPVCECLSHSRPPCIHILHFNACATPCARISSLFPAACLSSQVSGRSAIALSIRIYHLLPRPLWLPTYLVHTFFVSVCHGT